MDKHKKGSLGSLFYVGESQTDRYFCMKINLLGSLFFKLIGF